MKTKEIIYWFKECWLYRYFFPHNYLIENTGINTDQELLDQLRKEMKHDEVVIERYIKAVKILDNICFLSFLSYMFLIYHFKGDIRTLSIFTLLFYVLLVSLRYKLKHEENKRIVLYEVGKWMIKDVINKIMTGKY